MSIEISPKLALPYLAAAQAQKHVTHNEALRMLDAIVHLSVIDDTQTSAPSARADGDRYIIAGEAVEEWSGRTHQIAAWQEGAWTYFSPQVGWICWIESRQSLVIWGGTEWRDLETGGGGGGTSEQVDKLGINATADLVNRLSVRSENSLFDHDGGDHRLKINKSGELQTASVLFQDAYQGFAELGLAGDNHLRVKVRDDSDQWRDALIVDRMSGHIAFPATPMREFLQSSLTLHVRTSGDDSTGDGSIGAPYRTVARATSRAVNMDCRGFDLTIDVGAGSFAEAVVLPAMLGSGTMRLTGAGRDLTTLESVHVRDNASWHIVNLKLNSGHTGVLIANYSQAYISNLDFGSMTYAHIGLRGISGRLQIMGDYVVSGNTGIHILADGGNCIISSYGRTVTFEGPIQFSARYAHISVAGIYVCGGMTFNGSATGPRYYVSGHSLIETGGQGEAYLPGNANGGVDTATFAVYR